MPFPDDAFASIHTAFADVAPADFIVAVGATPEPVPIVWTDEPADPLQGFGSKVRRLSCEIRQAHLPVRPTKAAKLVRKGVTYSVLDVNERDDIAAWVLILKASA